MLTIFQELIRWYTFNTDNLRYHVKQNFFKIEVLQEIHGLSDPGWLLAY